MILPFPPHARALLLVAGCFLAGCGGAPEVKNSRMWLDQDGDGYAPGKGDCDDGTLLVGPTATEVCDGVDNNCDGEIDENPADGLVFAVDEDGDGYGSETITITACALGEGMTEDATDCEDASAAAYPGGVEVCDGLDNDCNDVTDDDATDAPVWHLDQDRDGYGNAAEGDPGCEGPSDYVLDDSDCDDVDPETWPGAPDTCDGTDQDCDGAEPCTLGCFLSATETPFHPGPSTLGDLAAVDGILYVTELANNNDTIHGFDPDSGEEVDTFSSPADEAVGLGANATTLYMDDSQNTRIFAYDLTTHLEGINIPGLPSAGGLTATEAAIWQVGDGTDGFGIWALNPLDGTVFDGFAFPSDYGQDVAALDNDGAHLLYLGSSTCDAPPCDVVLYTLEFDGTEVCQQTLLSGVDITIRGMAASRGKLYLSNARNGDILVFE